MDLLLAHSSLAGAQAPTGRMSCRSREGSAKSRRHDQLLSQSDVGGQEISAVVASPRMPDGIPCAPRGDLEPVAPGAPAPRCRCDAVSATLYYTLRAAGKLVLIYGSFAGVVATSVTIEGSEAKEAKPRRDF